MHYTPLNIEEFKKKYGHLAPPDKKGPLLVFGSIVLLAILAAILVILQKR